MKLLLTIILVGACIGASAGADAEFLSDARHRIVHTGQAWGVLGIDTCAHAGQTPLPMQIGDKVYRKGLGHHAPGEIVIDLEGMYDRFEAEVGVQKQASNTGSVVFQVYVDDEKRFDSGVMRESDVAKPVSIPIDGAAELRLVALDAGDGITCDCANWAEARLTLSANPRPVAAREFADVAPFARVVTFDPKRMTGSKANRVQEFHADDLFLDTDLTPRNDGAYEVKPQDGLACIGLQWLERRILRGVGIEFAEAVPSTESLQVQAWIGESPWQGEWRPMKGKLTVNGNRLSMKVERTESGGTWKIRWIWPQPDGPATVRRLTASSGARWSTIDVRLEIPEGMPGETARIEAYNGEIVGAPDGQRSVAWDLSKPIRLKVRYLKTRSWETDRTVIRLELPLFGCGIAIDDLVANKAVWIPDYPLYAAIVPDGPSLSQYKKQIEGRKTILGQVRAMPDQTFEQAMAKTHNPIQDNGPTMLSLACDNHKFVVEQDGSIRFAPPGVESNPSGGDLREMTCLMRPHFGTKDLGRAQRSLMNGYLPSLSTVFADGEVEYIEGCKVVPYDESSSKEWPFINTKPLLVTEFVINNYGTEPVDVRMSLESIADIATNKATESKRIGRRTLILSSGKLLAIVEGDECGALPVSADGGTVTLHGKLSPNEQACLRVFIPAWDLAAEKHTEVDCEGKDLNGQFHLHWSDVLSPSMQVHVPDPLLENAIRASQVHCVIAARTEEEGKRIAPWIASDRYGPLESEANSIIRGMMLMGHQDFARKSLDFFIKRYGPEGFLTTGYTLMGTGWHLWTIGEYFDLTQDKRWMMNVAGEVERACKWIVDQRAKTKALRLDGTRRPEYGLMPPGVGADWNAFAYHFALNGYYYAGLKEASEALRAVRNSWAQGFLDDAADFRRDIRGAYVRAKWESPVVPLRDGTWVPWYPGQLHCPGPTGRFFPGEDGNRSWCYDVELGAHHLLPQGLLDVKSLFTDWMTNHMEDVQFLADGWFDYPAEENKADWFNLGGFSKVQPYYTRNAEIYAMRDDVKPFIRSYFNTLAAMLNTENLSLWEHFHNAGAWNKTHETGYFLQQTAWMFVRERSDELWLAPYVTDRWLEDGKEIKIDNAPTRLGKVGYRIKSHVKDGFITAEIDLSAASGVLAVHLRLRHPEGKTPKSVSVPGWPEAYFSDRDSTVTIRGDVKGKLTVRVEY